MRGKGTAVVFANDIPRITPAYAGKSNAKSSSKSVKEDHPRLCGEKELQEYAQQSTGGSPPPMRGKEWQNVSSVCIKRITPAYAGKRLRLQHHCQHNQDHPRLCGEKAVHILHIKSYTGSPPPMRGKAHIGLRNAVRYRITPAYAGKREMRTA